MNLYEKLVEVRKSIPYLKKDKRSFNYSYASGIQVLSAVRQKIDELGLLLVSHVLEIQHEVVEEKIKEKPKYQNQSLQEPKEEIKKERLVTIKMKFVWINAEDINEKPLEVLWISMGQNAREKGIGAALTYAERYFLLKSFLIPTDELDPDAYQNEYGKESNGYPDNLASEKEMQLSRDIVKDIAKEIVRTGIAKEAIHIYCTAQKIPIAAKDCNQEQLMMILKHLRSLPTNSRSQQNIGNQQADVVCAQEVLQNKM